MHRTGHILLLHHSEGERMRYVADWFGAGVTNEDQLIYVDVAGRGAETLTAELAARGFRTDRAVRDKRLEFVSLEHLLDVGVGGRLHDARCTQRGSPGCGWRSAPTRSPVVSTPTPTVPSRSGWPGCAGRAGSPSCASTTGARPGPTS